MNARDHLDVPHVPPQLQAVADDQNHSRPG